MSYQTVLAVVSEHSGSTVAARYAIALAKLAKARLVLHAIHPEGTNEAIFRHSERHQDQLLNVSNEQGIPVTRIIETGSITQLLPKRVVKESADLVFYPLLPDERYGATTQAQNVHQLLNTVKADLAIMRIIHMGNPHPRHILVPLASVVPDPARRISFISTLARSFNAQVTLFHRQAERNLGVPADLVAVRNNLHHQHVQVLERSAQGNIAKAIMMEAISHHNDLIVLGASERGLLRRLFFGDPAGDVMHHPPCNTILFRAYPDRS